MLTLAVIISYADYEASIIIIMAAKAALLCLARREAMARERLPWPRDFISVKILKIPLFYES